MAKKNLDKMFQEQLKNLEVSPNERVWNNIEAKLTKKKRKVFPVWWFTSGVASILVLGLLFYTYTKEENQKINIDSNEVITKNPKEKPIFENKHTPFKSNQKNKHDILISKEEKGLKSPQEQELLAKDFNDEKVYQTKKRQEKILVFDVKPIVIYSNEVLQSISLALEDILAKNFQKAEEKISIDDVVKTEEKNELEREKSWSVAPTFAVLQSNSLTDSSPINSSLASSTSGENSYSYGVQIAYQINDRWSIQSGIHRQEISYANKQVVINRSSERNPFATTFSNGDLFSFDAPLNTFDAPSNTISAGEDIEFSRSFFSSNVESNAGNILQNYGYIEVPIEIKYNFSKNTKLQTQLVTGFSSLFLNKNQVILNTQNFSRALEANNLNNINFSGNLGFDFNYFLSKTWSFHLNPMFKVQLNTFSDDANGFAPFHLGLYTGIKYQF